MQNISSVVEVNKDIYTRGCIEAITETLEPNMNMVSIGCFVFAIVQVKTIPFKYFIFQYSLNYLKLLFSSLQCFLPAHFRGKSNLN